MNCPVCQNEEIKDGQNFCQICGFDLKKGPKVLTEEQVAKNRISEEVLKESIIIQARLTELYSMGISAVWEWGIQLSEDNFRATFQQYETEPRSGELCVELYTNHDGVKFFTLSDRP